MDPSETLGRIIHIKQTLDHMFDVARLEKELDEAKEFLKEAARRHETYYWAKLSAAAAVPKND